MLTVQKIGGAHTATEAKSGATATLNALGKHAVGIDHVAIACHDLEESVKFYTQVLSFELHERRKTEGKHAAMVSAVLKAGAITVVLLQGVGPDSQVSKFVEHFGPGVQHLAIAVENLPELAEGLKAEGLEFDTTIINSPGLRQIFTHREPGSGMMFELTERMGGDFSDQSVRSHFEQLEKKDAF